MGKGVINYHEQKQKNKRMKDVSIVSITLDNFKGVHYAEHQWDGNSVDVCGDNGTGKSTLADAACWCLSGKDMMGRKDYCIIPRLEDGSEEEGIATSVTMKLHVSDQVTPEDITLERAYVATYSAQADGSKRLSGHTTKCFVNGAPRKVSVYSQEVEAIMGTADDYRCLTDPVWFCSTMTADKRRTLLLEMAGGEISDEEIAQGGQAWQEMLREAGKRSVEQLRADITTARNKTKEEQNRVDAAIEQTRRLMPEEQDWATLEQSLEGVRQQQEEVAQRMQDSAAKAKAEDEGRIEARKRIMDMRLRLQDLSLAEERKASEEHDQAEREHARMAGSIRAMEGNLLGMKARLNSTLKMRDDEARDMEACERDLAAKREEWNQVNAQTYTGSDLCPTCGQPLPTEMTVKARETWNKAKAEALDKVVKSGQTIGERVRLMRASLERTEGDIAAQRDEIQQAEACLEQKRQEYARHMVPQRRCLVYTDEMKALDMEIRQAEAELEAMKRGQATDEQSKRWDYERRSLEAEAQRLSASLAIREVCLGHQKELDRLEQKAAELAQEKARCLYILDAITGFIKEKSRRTEQRVNGLFQGLTFRLFETTLEGSVQATCTPLVDGVPYDAANKAARINAGLEAIERISQHKGLRLPVWIDNAESTRVLYDNGTQQIRLRVTADKQLTDNIINQA